MPDDEPDLSKYVSYFQEIDGKTTWKARTIVLLSPPGVANDTGIYCASRTILFNVWSTYECPSTWNDENYREHTLHCYFIRLLPCIIGYMSERKFPIYINNIEHRVPTERHCTLRVSREPVARAGSIYF